MRLRKTLTTLTALTSLASPTLAETLTCDIPGISVTAQDQEHAALVCSAADQATALLKTCNLPEVTTPIKIDVVDDLIADCHGVYHCGDNSIDVLSPTIMEERGEPDGVFAHLSTPAYFQSIVVHELTHAATQGMPCPFDICYVGAEYVAYALQVMSLNEDALNVFENAAEMDRAVPEDELHHLILFMAPDLFAQKTWAHLSQQDAPCAYIAQLISGEVFLDKRLYELE